MNKHIEKLIKEYERKVSECDELLEKSLYPSRTKKRQDGDDLEDVANDIRVVEARKQAYFQAMKDIESLLLYVD